MLKERYKPTSNEAESTVFLFRMQAEVARACNGCNLLRLGEAPLVPFCPALTPFCSPSDASNSAPLPWFPFYNQLDSIKVVEVALSTGDSTDATMVAKLGGVKIP